MKFHELAEKMKRATPIAYSQLNQIPAKSGIYTAWLKNVSRCFYVGKSKKLVSRIRSHFSGQRGSNQFCLLVYDEYVHMHRPDGIKTSEVNTLTADWIRDNVVFKIVEVSENELNSLENIMRKEWKSILNPI